MQVFCQVKYTCCRPSSLTSPCSYLHGTFHPSIKCVYFILFLCFMCSALANFPQPNPRPGLRVVLTPQGSAQHCHIETPLPAFGQGCQVLDHLGKQMMFACWHLCFRHFHCYRSTSSFLKLSFWDGLFFFVSSLGVLSMDCRVFMLV